MQSLREARPQGVAAVQELGICMWGWGQGSSGRASETSDIMNSRHFRGLNRQEPIEDGDSFVDADGRPTTTKRGDAAAAEGC